MVEPVSLCVPHLALTPAVLGSGVFCQPFRLRVVDYCRVRVQTLRHLVTDYVHQPLKHRLHVDVLFCGCLEEFQTWKSQQAYVM